MRQPAHSSPSSSPAKKLPPPSPKGPDGNFLSYQETGRRREAENLNFMSPTLSTASRQKQRRMNESPDRVDDGAFREESDNLFLDDPVIRSPFPRSNLIQRMATNTTIPGKVGFPYSSVCSTVFEFLLLLTILVLSAAFFTLLNTHCPHHSTYCHHHHHHYHNLELDNYPVAFLRLIDTDRAPSHYSKVVEPPTGVATDVEEAGKMMVRHPVQPVEESYSSVNVPMKAAQVTPHPNHHFGRTALEKGKGKEDLSPKANPLVKKMGFDFEVDDNNRPSLVPIFVVTAVASSMVLLLLFSFMLVRKTRSYRRGIINHQYQRHLEPGFLHTESPDMPETWSSGTAMGSRSRGGMKRNEGQQ